MEFVPLESSSLVEHDLLLAEIKQEIENEAECIEPQAEKSSTTIVDNMTYDTNSSSDTIEAEISNYDGDVAFDVKPELFDSVNSEPSQEPDLDTDNYKVSKKTHYCKICGQWYAREKSLSAHIRTVHTDMNTNTTGDKRDARKRLRLPRMPQNRVKNPYSLRRRCENQKPATANNRKVFSEDWLRPHRCTICSKRFLNSRDLNLHARIHSGEKPNKCSECAKEFTTISQLRSHYRTHTQEPSYSCTQCDQKFVWLNSLKRHNLRVHNEGYSDASATEYPCSICSDLFEDLNKLENHMLSHGTAKNGTASANQTSRHRKKKRLPGGKHSYKRPTRSSCETCGKGVMDMRKHMLIHDKKHECILCGCTFSVASTLNVHMRTHTGDRPYGCQHCPKRFTTQSHLTVHTRKHTREQCYQCPICEEKFVWLNSLKRHLQQHEETDDPTELSSIISRQRLAMNSSHMFEVAATATSPDSTPDREEDAFRDDSENLYELGGDSSVPDMQEHRKTHSGGIPTDVPKSVPTKKRLYPCIQCERSYKSFESLRAHTRIYHSGEKKFVCAECGKRFYMISNLKSHMRKHSDSRNFKCGECGETFMWRNSFRRHMWRHSGLQPERSQACPLCNKCFFTSYELRQHMIVHSGEKPFSCSQCGRRFTHQSSLRTHQYHSHVPQPRVPCPECGRKFKSARVIRAHIRLAHRVVMFKCPQCGLEFLQQNWLDCHVWSHLSQRHSFTCDECRLPFDSAELNGEWHSQHPSIIGNVINQACDTGVITPMSVPLPNDLIMSVSAGNGSTVENSTCDVPVTNHNSIIPTSGLAEQNEGRIAVNSELASKKDFETSETTSKTAFSELCGNHVVGNGGSAVRSMTEDGAVRQERFVVNGSVDKEEISEREVVTSAAEEVLADGVTTSTVESGNAVPTENEVPNVENEVRCVRCCKLRPPQICPVCNRTFESLPDHIGNHAGKNPYNISALLGIQTTYVDQYAEQRKPEPIHGEGEGIGDSEQVGGEGDSESQPRKKKKQRQQCTQCGGTFSQLAEHMARVHSATEETFMCTDCGKFLRNATTLRVHMESKTCQKLRVCSICERSFKSDCALKAHVKSHASVDGPHACKKCRQVFSTPEELKAHVSQGTCGKSFPCCVCGKMLSTVFKLKQHERLHSEERDMRFECGTCGKRCRSRVRLMEHMTLHTMEKNYVCPTCGKRFRLRGSLERHRVIHSGVKRFECNECGKKFAFSRDCKRHKRIHTGERPYVCTVCGSGFIQWNGLHQHTIRNCGRKGKALARNSVTL